MKPEMLIPAVICVLSIAAAVHASEQRIDLGNVTGGNINNAQEILEKKCTACHSINKIDAAMSAGWDMSLIQRKMEKKGAKLNSKEREVLGIFWQQSKPVSKK